MTDALKGAYKLRLGADGRSAENWPSYKVQVDNLLSAKHHGDIYLDDVINNVDSGAAIADPGTQADWIAADLLRTPAMYLAASTAYKAYKRADKMARGLLMSTLP